MAENMIALKQPLSCGQGLLRLSIKWQILRTGKEGCARETQEGCRSPVSSRPATTPPH